MSQDLNTKTTSTTFKVFGSEFTITRTRPTKKAIAVAKVDKYFAKHVRTSARISLCLEPSRALGFPRKFYTVYSETPISEERS